MVYNLLKHYIYQISFYPLNQSTSFKMKIKVMQYLHHVYFSANFQLNIDQN